MNRKELIEQKIKDLLWSEEYHIRTLETTRMELEVYKQLLEQEVKDEQDGFVRLEE